MTVDSMNQGDLALLSHPVARRLLDSATPARLGYIAIDGTPRVTPMWFEWNGQHLVLGAAGSSPKVRALTAHPRVAVTIDSQEAPYEVLYVRGAADVEIVEGAVKEYLDAALRYLGPNEGEAFRNDAMANFKHMARISIQPEWVGLIDFQTRYPASY